MTRRMVITAAVPMIATSLLAQGAGGKLRGTMMAPIHLELFSDFQCPACKALHEQTVKPLIADYVDKSKVYLIHREFPLPMHPYARPAAALAVAAGKIGKYEQVADALFAKQDAWSKDGQYEAAALSVLSPADAKKVKELAATTEVKGEIDKDFASGSGRIQQTPTMILTRSGRVYPHSGFVTYNIFRRFVDELLSK